MKKTLLIILLSIASFLTPNDAFARRPKTEPRTPVTTEAPADNLNHVAITNPSTQLAGEWTIESVGGKAAITREHPYLLFDFANNRLYGNNGCNVINGTFILQGSNVVFNDLVTSGEICENTMHPATVMHALAEVRSMKLFHGYNGDIIHLYNGRGTEMMTLRHKSLEFANGTWLVKTIGTTDVAGRNLRMVIDVETLTINVHTVCNFINGIITLDPTHDFGIEFEDLGSAKKRCENFNLEGMLLLALEETKTCDSPSKNELRFYNKDGKLLMTATRTSIIR